MSYGNGSPKREYSLFACFPKEIAENVKRSYELGVSMVHLHARGEDGNSVGSLFCLLKQEG